MKFRSENIRDIKIIKVTGRLDSTTSAEFLDFVLKEIEGGQVKIVLGMKEVDYISSAGIRALILSLRKSNELSGKLVLAEVNPNVLNVLKMADILSVLPVISEFDQILKFME